MAMGFLSKLLGKGGNQAPAQPAQPMPVQPNPQAPVQPMQVAQPMSEPVPSAPAEQPPVSAVPSAPAAPTAPASPLVSEPTSQPEVTGGMGQEGAGGAPGWGDYQAPTPAQPQQSVSSAPTVDVGAGTVGGAQMGQEQTTSQEPGGGA